MAGRPKSEATQQVRVRAGAVAAAKAAAQEGESLTDALSRLVMAGVGVPVERPPERRRPLREGTAPTEEENVWIGRRAMWLKSNGVRPSRSSARAQARAEREAGQWQGLPVAGGTLDR